MSQNAVTDFQALSFYVGGSEITGFSDANAYNAEYQVDQVSLLAGVKGLGAYSKTFNLSAVITIELLQTSNDNFDLGLLHQVNLALPGGFLFETQLLDANGATHQLCLNACIMKFPAITYSANVEVRTWSILCGQLRTVVGGAKEPTTGSLADAKKLVQGLDIVPVAV